jgi:hypothetical protein
MVRCLQMRVLFLDLFESLSDGCSHLLTQPLQHLSLKRTCEGTGSPGEQPEKRPGKAPETRAGMPQLAGRAELRKRQLLCKSTNLVLFLPRNRLWPPQREEPLCIRERPVVQLWTAKMRLQAVGILHFGDRGTIRRKANWIQREGGRLFGEVDISAHQTPHKSAFFRTRITSVPHSAVCACIFSKIIWRCEMEIARVERQGHCCQ